MGKKTEERKLGDHVYVVSQFGALQGRAVLFRLTKMLGPALAGILKDGLSEAGFGAALSGWAASANVEDFTWLCDQFAEVSQVKQPTSSGLPIVLPLGKVFDDHFVGHYSEMLKWLAFAIMVNFADFLDVKGLVTSALGAMAETRTQSESKSPKE